MVDTHCVTCDYDLRGLPANGRCPECNHPVQLSLIDIGQAVPLETLRRLRRSSLCFLIPTALATIGGVLFFYAIHTGRGEQSINTSLAVVAPLWLVKIGETLGLFLATYGLYLISSGPSKSSRRDPGQALRRILGYGPFVAGLAAGAVLLSFIPAVARTGLMDYLFETCSGLAILILPPAALAHFGILHKHSKKSQAARYCWGAAVVLGCLNASVLYQYASRALLFREVPAPTYFSATSPWMHYAGGLPLPVLSTYHVAGNYDDWLFIPIATYILVAVAFLRTHRVASLQIAERTIAP